MEKIRVLFLAASPKVSPLSLDEEIRAITAKIRAAEYRESLEVVSRWAVRPDDVQQALLEVRPHVLHFSGHGTKSDELMLLDVQGNSTPLSKTALVHLLRILKDNLRLVVLNACYSTPQAEAITQVIDCAVGMNCAIGDAAAITFAAAFYRAIGFGRSIQTAFDLGVSSIMLEAISEDSTPALVSRQGIDPASIILLERNPQNLSSKPAESPHRSSGGGVTGRTTNALSIWREKLAYFEEQEAVVSDPAQKFALRKQIAEAKQRIADMGPDSQPNGPLAL